MTITTTLATLRAALLRELVRLNARSWEGGPHVVVRQGVLLLAWADEQHEATDATLAALRALPDGAGPTNTLGASCPGPRAEPGVVSLLGRAGHLPEAS